MLGLALAQIPEQWRSKPILVRADSAGASHALLDELTALGLEYAVGFAVTAPIQAAIRAVPKRVWAAAVTADGAPRDGADVAEITGLLTLPGRPQGMRVIVRRERPHPGAQLSLFEQADGWRYQTFVTNTGLGQLAFLDARHRAHARVEDRIRTGKSCGIGKFPSQLAHVNAAWLKLALTAADLLAWAQTGLLADEPRPGPRRTPPAALPAAPHRRPHHPKWPPHLAPPSPKLALGHRPGPRVRTPPPDPNPHLTRHSRPYQHPGQAVDP